MAKSIHKKILVFCLILNILFIVSGCYGDDKATDTDNYTQQSISRTSTESVKSINTTADEGYVSTSDPTDSSTASTNIKYQAMESYKSVLQNKAEFFSTDASKNVYLNVFLTNGDIYKTTFNVTHFAILDMDDDKIPEIVLELAVDNNVNFYEVLHFAEDKKVNGYNFGIRGLGDIKADGTFSWSNSACNSGYGKLSFQSDGSVTTDNIGYYESQNDNGVVTTTFFIDKQPVTEEAYRSFENEQQEKKGVTWYEFSQENIETKLK